MAEAQTVIMSSMKSWFIATFVACVAGFGLHILRKALIEKFANVTSCTTVATVVRDIIIRTNYVFISVVAISLGCSFLTLSSKASLILEKTLIVTTILQVGIWAHGLLSYTLEKTGFKEHVDTRLAKGAIHTLKTILQVILWGVIALLILTNLGFKVGPLLAGLGIGGIAIALGVQHTLQDIAASLSILFDKPFMVGDYIVVGDFMGTVECIGIKTTRLLSLSGEQIIFSNNDLLNSRIRNYKKMIERRVLFNLQVPYDTVFEKINLIPKIIKEIINNKRLLRFDRTHLKQFTNYSYEFETVYYVLAPEYNTYMDMQQQINFEIIQNFEKQGITFALPVQNVLLDNLT